VWLPVTEALSWTDFPTVTEVADGVVTVDVEVEVGGASGSNRTRRRLSGRWPMPAMERSRR